MKAGTCSITSVTVKCLTSVSFLLDSFLLCGLHLSCFLHLTVVLWCQSGPETMWIESSKIIIVTTALEVKMKEESDV